MRGDIRDRKTMAPVERGRRQGTDRRASIFPSVEKSDFDQLTLRKFLLK